MTPVTVAAALIVIKMTIVLAVALAVTRMLRQRSAALRHWVLATGLALAALTPLASNVMPAWTVPGSRFVNAPAPSVTRGQIVLSSQPLDATTAAATGTAPSAWAPDIDSMAFVVWLTGAVVAMLFMSAGFLRLRHLARHAIPLHRGAWPAAARDVQAVYGLTRPVRLLQSEHPALLVTWGLFRPRVLLPAVARHWPSDRIRIVLQHEMAHVLRRDWAVQIAAFIFAALCWFHPLAWIVVRRLRQESEYACDDVVLRHGVDGDAYAAHLLAIARTVCQQRARWVPAPAIARPSTLEQRIQAMLNRTSDRQPPTTLTRIAFGTLLGVAAMAVAGGGLAAATAADEVVIASLSAAQVEITSPVTSPPARAAAPAQSANTSQATPAGVAGLIVDQLGGFLPGTTLTLTNEATGGALVAVTDRAGRFEFAGVRPGRYALDASLPGFQNSRSVLTLEAGRTQARTISMSVGSLQETITVTGTRGAAAAAEAPRPPALPVRDGRDAAASLQELRTAFEQATFRAGTMGGMIKPPTKTRHVNPIYPGALQSQGVEGQVELIAVIGIDGKVVEVAQPRSADTADPLHPDLIGAASAAVQQWEFTPTLLNGVPVQVTMRVHTRFSLR